MGVGLKGIPFSFTRIPSLTASSLRSLALKAQSCSATSQNTSRRRRKSSQRIHNALITVKPSSTELPFLEQVGDQIRPSAERYFRAYVIPMPCRIPNLLAGPFHLRF